MHVCLDVSPTAQQHAGLGRYAGEVARALDQAQSVELALFYNRQGEARLPDYLSHIVHKTVNIGNKPWRMGVLLSQMLRRPMDRTFGAIEIFHATNHLLAHFGRARTVFTLHDLIFLHFPEYHLPYNRWFLTLAMPRFLRAADVIITPSECSRQDAIKFYGLPESKIKVIYEAPAPDFKPVTDPANLERVRQSYHLPPKFMGDITYFPDLFFKYAMCGWIGHHECKKMVFISFGFLFQVLYIDISRFIAIHDYHFGSCHSCTGRIGAMSG